MRFNYVPLGPVADYGHCHWGSSGFLTHYGISVDMAGFARGFPGEGRRAGAEGAAKRPCPLFGPQPPATEEQAGDRASLAGGAEDVQMRSQMSTITSGRQFQVRSI